MRWNRIPFLDGEVAIRGCFTNRLGAAPARASGRLWSHASIPARKWARRLRGHAGRGRRSLGAFRPGGNQRNSENDSLATVSAGVRGAVTSAHDCGRERNVSALRLRPRPGARRSCAGVHYRGPVLPRAVRTSRSGPSTRSRSSPSVASSSRAGPPTTSFHPTRHAGNLRVNLRAPPGCHRAPVPVAHHYDSSAVPRSSTPSPARPRVTPISIGRSSTHVRPALDHARRAPFFSSPARSGRRRLDPGLSARGVRCEVWATPLTWQRRVVRGSIGPAVLILLVLAAVICPAPFRGS